MLVSPFSITQEFFPEATMKSIKKVAKAAIQNCQPRLQRLIPHLNKLRVCVVLGSISVSVCLVSDVTFSQEALSSGTPTSPPTGATDELNLAVKKETGTSSATPCRSRPGMAPEIVLIEAASFTMGSPTTEIGRDSGETQHPVTLQRGYGIGRCEVTVAEYRLFIRDTGYKTQGNQGTGCRIWSEDKNIWIDEPSAGWESPGFPQNGDHPVVCVSWKDANQYARWLSFKTNSVYRLPSETEWEYAARGTVSGEAFPFHWGEKPNEACEYANGMDLDGKKRFPDRTTVNCSDGAVYTTPAGQYRSNGFGLRDTAGNVWEWTADCWHSDYAGAPDDGRPWGEENRGDCTRRSVRGGGWNYGPLLLRSAYRTWYNADTAHNFLGFRLARDL